MSTLASTKLKLAVFKFASCDGCQLSLLECEDELLTVAGLVEIAYFLEASSTMLDGPYDVTLVEGSITTPHDKQRIQEIRKQSKVLITIGACATSGGIQALRNWGDHQEFLQAVYARPEYISSLATSTAIADHVKVEYELRGCPINRHQLVEVIRTLAAGQRPRMPSHSVCMDCKLRGTVCIAVAQGVPCLGPITHTGCGAICPAYDRGCYTCFGPAHQANTSSLTSYYQSQGITAEQLVPLLRNYNALAPAFCEVSSRLDGRIALPLAGS
jgi:sulfhydrogenase subunit delta